MPIFKIEKDKLKQIREVPFKNEKEIQRMTEQNLEEIFGLEFVKTEVAKGDLRMDTLAFDNETKSFVVIEYKKDRSFSVIDQGYAYLSLLLNNKADFILEYNECKGKSLRRGDVDWSQSRVIFISPQFTKYQRKAIDFKDLPIELWEVKKYENNTVLFNQLKSLETSESITKISSKNSVIRKVNKEIKVYTEERHLQKMPEEIVAIYEELKERILNLGENIEIRPTKNYIGFSPGKRILFVWFYFLKSKKYIRARLWIKRDELDDYKNVSKSYKGWGTEIIITPDSDIDYIMTLIKQAYKKHAT